jgi:hypothetical protein
MTIVPHNQANLLSNSECKSQPTKFRFSLMIIAAWLPAAPGKTFPTPNIPIDIIKQIHVKLLAAAPTPAKVDLPTVSLLLSEDSGHSSDDESRSSTASGEPRQEDEGDNDEDGWTIAWTPTPTPQQTRVKMPPELPPNSSALSSRTTRLEEPRSSPIASSVLRKMPPSGVPSSFEQSTARDSDVEMEEEAPKPLNLLIKKTPVTSKLGSEERSVAVDRAMGSVLVPCTSAAPSTPTAHIGLDHLTKRELSTNSKDLPPPKRVKSLNTVSYGFSQEAPVSQDPAYRALQERRSFFSSISRSPSNVSNDENRAESVAERVLAQFHSAYPEHKFDLRKFLALCKMVDRLQREGRMQHKFLWDDFIIRYVVDYRAYTLSAIEECEDAIPYYMFYQNHIEEPKYMKLIMTPQKLHEILAAEAVRASEQE